VWRQSDADFGYGGEHLQKYYLAIPLTLCMLSQLDQAEADLAASAWSLFVVIVRLVPCSPKFGKYVARIEAHFRKKTKSLWPCFAELASDRRLGVATLIVDEDGKPVRAPGRVNAGNASVTWRELYVRAFCDEVVTKTFCFILAFTLPVFLCQVDSMIDFVKDALAVAFICQIHKLNNTHSYMLQRRERRGTNKPPPRKPVPQTAEQRRPPTAEQRLPQITEQEPALQA